MVVPVQQILRRVGPKIIIPDAVVYDPAGLQWVVQEPEPVRTVPVDVGWFTTDPQGLTQPETTLVSKWFMQASEPVRVMLRAVDTGRYILDPLPIPDVAPAAGGRFLPLMGVG